MKEEQERRGVISNLVWALLITCLQAALVAGVIGVTYLGYLFARSFDLTPTSSISAVVLAGCFLWLTAANYGSLAGEE